MHVCVCASVGVPSVGVQVWVCVCVCLHACMHIYVCVCVCMKDLPPLPPPLQANHLRAPPPWINSNTEADAARWNDLDFLWVIFMKALFFIWCVTGPRAGVCLPGQGQLDLHPGPPATGPEAPPAGDDAAVVFGGHQGFRSVVTGCGSVTFLPGLHFDCCFLRSVKCHQRLRYLCC